MTGIERAEVPIDASDVVSHVAHWLEAKQIIVYSVIHHTQDMRDRGVDPEVDAWTIIFGKPELGATFLAETPDIVVDIPLRIGVYQRPGSPSVVVRRRMAELLSDHHRPSLDAKSRPADDLIDECIHMLSSITPHQ